MLRRFSNWLVSRKNRKRMLGCIYILLVVTGIFLCGRKLYNDHLRDVIRDTGNNEPVKLSDKEERIQYEKRKKDADRAYKEGKAGMSGDEIAGSVGNEESGDIELIGQDWYDNEGNLLWKGIIKDNYTRQEKMDFKKAYQEYERRTSEENEETALDIDKTGTKASRLTNLCHEYNEKIPYAEAEYSFYLGYYMQEDGYDNTPYIKKGQHGSGLCGLGYITWVMRNVLGKTPAALKGGNFEETKASKVGMRELRVGDICKAELAGGSVYGVVSYITSENHAIVSFEDSMGTIKFPTGCNHYAYIKAQKDAYIYDYGAVDFKEFYRLKEWE